MKLSRHQFLIKTVAGSVGLMLPLSSEARQQTPKPAPLKPELVQEFVGASHGKFDRVKEMLAAEPNLLHTSWDWGGGDFESGIEAAGHVGNTEIATFLLSKGARYNIFLASMLGHLETVKNVLTFNPGLLNSTGPHGFTLLHHANKGGEQSKPVVDYLVSLGAKETKYALYK